MRKMGLNALRKEFLDYFGRNGHYIEESFSLVPINDNSILLVNAGMQPLKEYFLGNKKPPHTKLANCQKCFRTNDIDNVGKTSRHATLFEMLGNFSFGDYFKSESLSLGWDFLVKQLEIDPKRLWASVYEEDDDAYAIWRDEIGIPEERIVRLGKEDNFWEIGLGPCGPCSEIYFDRGEKYSCDNPDCKPGCECDRYIEIWNHVFSQFDKQDDGSYKPLKQKNIDTGMGLERIAVIIQDVTSIFDIDVIKAIMDKVKSCSKVDVKKEENLLSLRVVTDHIKSVSFLISDGVNPSNEGRGYVLRRVFRRAVRHAMKLQISRSDFICLVDAVIESYGNAYPILIERCEFIKKLVAKEYDRFEATLNQGLQILEDEIERSGATMSGEKIFMLYDTYGFPFELTREILEERGIECDEDGFNQKMQLQREMARAALKDVAWDKEDNDFDYKTDFCGYESVSEEAEVLDFSNGELVLSNTPFYAEGGGQIGDRGFIYLKNGDKIRVIDTRRSYSGTIVHVIEGPITGLERGMRVIAEVDAKRRRKIERNHTATHLLHAALRKRLGNHVKQAGSLVTDTRLRFDFSHYEQVSPEAIKDIEKMVNNMIFNPVAIDYIYMTKDEAQEAGAIALFGEKYGQNVRVVRMGEHSVELCGGTHLDNTAKVGIFKIVSQTGIAAGIRRIEAITGDNVLELIEKRDDIISELGQIVKASENEIVSKVGGIMQSVKQLTAENQAIKAKLAKQSLANTDEDLVKIGDYVFVSANLKDVDQQALRNLGDSLVEKHPNGVIVLYSIGGERVPVLVMAGNKACEGGANSGNIAKLITKVIGGGGGGRKNMAQASGSDGSKIQEANLSVKKMLEEMWRNK